MENLEEEATKKHNVFSKLYENIRSEINNRSRSRFIGSYVITWVVINWKAPIYVLFADVPLMEKLTSNFCKPTIGSWLYPLIGVAIYIVIIPFLEEALIHINNSILHPLKIAKLHLEHKSSMEQLKKNIALEQQRNELISEMSVEGETKKLIANNKFLSGEVETLREAIESRDEIISKLEKENLLIRKTKTDYDLSENQIKVLKGRTFSNLFRTMYNDKTKSILKENVNPENARYLIEKGLIKEGELVYTLTISGISFVENSILL